MEPTMTKLSPRLELGPVVEMDELCAILTARTGLKRSQVQLALTELHEVTRDLARRGRPVKLPELGVFTPLKITGRVHLKGCRLDRTLNRALAADYAGKISDRRRLKWGPEEYRAFWNEAHPDDPVPAEEAARYQARHAVAQGPRRTTPAGLHGPGLPEEEAAPGGPDGPGGPGRIQGRSMLRRRTTGRRPPPVSHDPSGRPRQPDGHPRSKPLLALDRHPPPLRLDQGLGQREPQAGTTLAARPAARARPVEALEHVRQILRGDPFAAVADPDGDGKARAGQGAVPAAAPVMQGERAIAPRREAGCPPGGVCRRALSRRARSTCRRRVGSAWTRRGAPPALLSSIWNRTSRAAARRPNCRARSANSSVSRTGSRRSSS